MGRSRTTFASVIHTNTDMVVLTLFSSLTNVSIYSVYSLILTGIKNLIQSIASSFSATFGDMIAKKETLVLNNRFKNYETCYLTATTIIYSCSSILIVPFIIIYTKGITDAEYAQWIFGPLITFAEFIWAIRQPYNELVKAAGHFKETKKGAWAEAGINIVLSIILVWKFGLIGVAIGTLVAMVIRTIEFIYHTNKYILKRNAWKSVQKIAIIILEIATVIFTSKFITIPEMNSYLNWIIYALKIFAIAVTIILPINFILYKNDFIDILKILKKICKKEKK